MPLEFSAAAYRLGHSMIRDEYNFNRVFSDPARVPGASFAATLGLLFGFTGKGGMNGSPTLPSNWIIDWRRFFEVGRSELRNVARRLDPRLVTQLHQLPGTTPGQPTSAAKWGALKPNWIAVHRT